MFRLITTLLLAALLIFQIGCSKKEDPKTITGPTALGAPTGLAGSATGVTSVVLTWADNSSSEDGFKIRRMKTGGTWSIAGTTATDVKTFTDPNLGETDTYTWKVTAFKSDGSESDVSNDVSLTIGLLPPQALTTTTKSSNSISLIWTDGSKIGPGFTLQKMTGGAWTTIATKAAKDTVFEDGGLTPSTTYAYRVRSVKNPTTSDWTTELQVTTNVPSAIPAPTNLTANIMSRSSIQLEWRDNANDENGFRVERKEGTGSFVLLSNSAPNATSYLDAAASVGIEYTYRVCTVRNNETSDWSNLATARIAQDATPPRVPTNLAATALSSSVLRISWTENDNSVLGFRLEKSVDDGANWLPLGTTASNVLTYNDSNLVEGMSYRYKVRAYNRDLASDPAGPVTGTTLPATPTGLTAVRATESSINLNWVDVSNRETGYEVQYREEGGQFETITTINANSSSYTHSSLTSDVTYFYRIRSVLNGVGSSWSNTASATTTTTRPAAPTGLSASSTDGTPNTVQLRWTDNATNEIGYKVDIAANRGGPWSAAGEVGADAVTAQIANLPSEATRYFRVYAYSAEGESDYSNLANCRVTGLPPSPTALSAQSGGSYSDIVGLHWTDNSVSERGFIVEQSSDGVNGWVVVDTSRAEEDSSLVQTNLITETTYYFRVFAFNGVGRSDYTNVTSVEVIGKPKAPDNLIIVSFTYAQVNLSWSDNSHTETNYRIERSAGVPNAWRRIASQGANTTNYTDATVSALTTYYYRVAAFNPSGQVYSNVVQVTTPQSPPNTPRDLVNDLVGVDQVSLSWSKVGNNEQGFILERQGPDDNDFIEFARTGRDTAYFLDDSLWPETQYLYRVSAFNEIGESDYTNVDTATTLGTMIFTDNFEGYNVGGQPPNPPWVQYQQGGTGGDTVQSEMVHGGEKALKYVDPDAASFIWIYTPFFSINEAGPLTRGTLEAWVWIARGGTLGLHFYTAGGGTEACRTFLWGEDSTFKYLQGGQLNPAGEPANFPVEQWFKLDLKVNTDSSQYQIMVNDEPVGDPCPLLQQGGLGYFMLSTYSDVACPLFYMDDLQITRYWWGENGRQAAVDNSPRRGPMRRVGGLTPMWGAPTSRGSFNQR